MNVTSSSQAAAPHSSGSRRLGNYKIADWWEASELAEASSYHEAVVAPDRVLPGAKQCWDIWILSCMVISVHLSLISYAFISYKQRLVYLRVGHLIISYFGFENTFIGREIRCIVPCWCISFIISMISGEFQKKKRLNRFWARSLVVYA